MTKSYRNNGNPFLVYHVEDYDALDNVERFVGVYYVAKAQMQMFMLLTLEGWQKLEIDDYVVHLFGSDEIPSTLKTDTENTYTKSGFLIFKRPIFEKYFERTI